MSPPLSPAVSPAAAAALGAALLLAAPLGSPLLAQETGRTVTIDIGQRLEGSRNEALVPGGDATTLTSETTFGLTLESRTAREVIRASTGTVLRGVAGDAPRDLDFSDPGLQLSYALTGADADLSLSARLARADIAFTRPIELSLNEDGELEVISDLDDLRGTGIRQTRSLSADLDWGKRSRARFDAGVSVTELSYQDVTDPDLVDSLRIGARLGAGLEITPQLAARVGLSYGRTEEAGTVTGTSRGLSAGLTATGRSSELSARFELTEPENGDTRYGLTGAWAQEIPTGGQLQLSLGAVRTGEDTALTGSATYFKPLPTGRISAQLQRGVDSDTDGATELTTAAILQFDRPLDRLTGLGLEMGYFQSDNLDTDVSIAQTEISARVSRQLAQDWTASLGASRLWRDEDGDAASSDSVFVTFGRSFEGPF